METNVQIVSIVFGFAGVLATGIFGYRQVKINANATKQVDVYSEQTKRIDQVINGMQKIIDNLTAENQHLRSELIEFQKQLGDVRKQLDHSVAQRYNLERKLEDMTTQYDDLKTELKDKHLIAPDGNKNNQNGA